MYTKAMVISGLLSEDIARPPFSVAHLFDVKKGAVLRKHPLSSLESAGLNVF